jgi:hypothetical protein
MTITKLKPLTETKEFYRFTEVIDILSNNPNAAFTCDDYDNEYIAFGNEEDEDSGILCFFSGEGIRTISKKDNKVLMEVRVFSGSEPLVITADVFERKWKPVVFEKTYNLEIVYDVSFSDSDVIDAFGASFSELTADEKDEFLDNLLEDAQQDTPEYLIDGIDYRKV